MRSIINKRGSALVWAVSSMLILMIIVVGVLSLGSANAQRSIGDNSSRQAYLTARSAVDAVIAAIEKGDLDPADMTLGNFSFDGMGEVTAASITVDAETARISATATAGERSATVNAVMKFVPGEEGDAPEGVVGMWATNKISFGKNDLTIKAESVGFQTAEVGSGSSGLIDCTTLYTDAPIDSDNKIGKVKIKAEFVLPYGTPPELDFKEGIYYLVDFDIGKDRRQDSLRKWYIDLSEDRAYSDGPGESHTKGYYAFVAGHRNDLIRENTDNWVSRSGNWTTYSAAWGIIEQLGENSLADCIRLRINDSGEYYIYIGREINPAYIYLENVGSGNPIVYIYKEQESNLWKSETLSILSAGTDMTLFVEAKAGNVVTVGTNRTYNQGTAPTSLTMTGGINAPDVITYTNVTINPPGGTPAEPGEPGSGTGSTEDSWEFERYE